MNEYMFDENEYKSIASLFYAMKRLEQSQVCSDSFYVDLCKSLFKGLITLYSRNFDKKNESERFQKRLSSALKNRGIKQILNAHIAKEEIPSFSMWLENTGHTSSDTKWKEISRQINSSLFIFLTKNLAERYKRKVDLEALAKDVLIDHFKSEYAGLTRIDPKNLSPDLIDEKKSIGVEVTRGLTPLAICKLKGVSLELSETICRFSNSFFGIEVPKSLKIGAYLSLSEEAKNEITLSINRNNAAFAYVESKMNQSLAFAIEEKLRKLNGEGGAESSYKKEVKTIDLFIFEYQQQCVIPQEKEYAHIFKEIKDFINHKKYSRIFRFVFLYGSNYLLKFDIDGRLLIVISLYDQFSNSIMLSK